MFPFMIILYYRMVIFPPKNQYKHFIVKASVPTRYLSHQGLKPLDIICLIPQFSATGK